MAVSFYNLSLRPVQTGIPVGFEDVYIQGRSTLRVEFGFITTPSAGTVLTCTVELDGKTYQSKLSPIDIPLNQYPHRRTGTKTVSITLDSGLGAETYSRTIYVREYEPPRVIPATTGATEILCARCKGDGTMSVAGEYLRLVARRSYAPLTNANGGDRRNRCAVRYRWKTESADSYSNWKELLSGNDLSTDQVDLVITDQTLSVRNSYVFQIGVVDDLGNTHEVTRQIPATYDTPLHLGKGGRNIGLGQYCDYSHQDAVDVGWKIFFNAGIGIREVFRMENRNDGWAGGTLLRDALPDADVSLLQDGTVFLAVVYHYVKEVISTAAGTAVYHRMLIPVLCVKASGSIAGQDADLICGHHWQTLEGSLQTYEYHYPVKMTYDEDSDSYALDLNEDDPTVKHLAALYVLL